MGAQQVLVTGASGFIAKHIVAQLLDSGHSVRGSLRRMDRSDEVRAAVAPHLRDPRRAETHLSFCPLDLTSDDGWDAAMQGMRVLMHTASPFPMRQPTDPREVIGPAVDGARRAIRFANAHKVRRVILTSSVAAIIGAKRVRGRRVWTESDWTDLTSRAVTPYAASKTLAEQAAWDCIEDEAPGIAMTVINPGLVLGPPLDAHFGTSLRLVQRLLDGRDPALPNFGFPVVDVRDVAAMHLRAMERRDSIGKRFIGADRFMWYRDMARVLKAAYPARRIVTRAAPDWSVRLLALVDPAVRSIAPVLGRHDAVSAEAARTVLGMTFRPAPDSLRAAAAFLVGGVAADRGPPEDAPRS